MDKLSTERTKLDSFGEHQHYREYGQKKEIKYFETPEFKKYRQQWFECPENNIIPEYPLNLDIHVTNKCNLRCPFCPRTWKDLGGHYDEYGFMSYDLYTKIIDEGVKYGLKAVQFTADGETLLHARLEEMIQYAREKGALDIIVHTSAASLTEKRSLKLLKAGLHRLAISFDSPDKETYEKLRVGANYEKTFENIKRFARLRNELGYDLPTVRVQMVDQKINKAQRKQFDEMFMPIADTVGHIYYINYFGGPEAYTNKESLSVNDFKIGEQKLNLQFKCSYLWQRLIISWDGKVFPCFYGDTLLEKDGEAELLLGNANEQSIHEIWHGSQMTQLRKLHEEGDFSSCKTCRDCGRQYSTYEDDEGAKDKDWIPV